MINLEKTMIFLQKIIVFNQLFQFPKSKKQEEKNGINFRELRKSGYFASTNFCEYEIFKVINYRENGQNSRKPRKFLLLKYYNMFINIYMGLHFNYV